MLLERINELKLVETNAPDGLYRVNFGQTEHITTNFSLPSISTDIDTAEYYVLCPEFSSSFSDGDIVFINSRRKKIIGFLCKSAKNNTVLVTEKCDNLCDFCSQPPNENSDTHLFINAAQAIIEFNSKDVVGITGGEPTINKSKFLKFIDMLNIANNNTPLHILTNGRAFSDVDFCKEVVRKTKNRDVVWGIPLHGHNQALHDECVSSKGAFKDTVNGLINLSYSGAYIEIRTVVTKKNYRFLKNITELINSSFAFIPVHAIMNLEPKGWAKRNFDNLYISATDQISYIEDCVVYSGLINQEVVLFNYPLCTIPDNLRGSYRKSISDWKNYYPDFCDNCNEKELCGGFFVSSKGKYLDNTIARIKL
jgi:His-Xaa-Ser system radical SAM maturase HxsC